MKLAIIGFGRIGKMHTENIVSSHPGIISTIICHDDMDETRKWLRRKNILGIEVSSDIDKVLNNPEITGVIIAASTSAHVELIEILLPYKKHIFCEKPVSLTASTLATLAKKIEQAGIVFQVGFNRRFDTQFSQVKQAVINGEVGKLHFLKIKNRDPKRPDLNFIPRSGGLVLDFNTHDFDMIRYISDEEVIEVVAMGANLVDPKIGEQGDIDSILITLRLQSGSLALIDSSRETNYGYDQELEAFGENGSVKAMNLRENTVIRSINNKVSIAKPLKDFSERYSKAYALQTQLFLDAIKNNPSQTNKNVEKAPTKKSNFIIALPSISDSHAAVCIAEAVNKSLKSGKIEKVLYS